ncbi:hypothetical protein ZEAMMB73_Zm00001d052867 [Zea mays]|uniref:Uncharacterized protein n=1 Tax=Zea mays TaxID=4577 RepID=A0A1D6QKL3_MAIZE|nr:hypothetical protein ZEAMMB73_Zm00001d052867 [Zea mays]
MLLQPPRRPAVLSPSPISLQPQLVELPPSCSLMAEATLSHVRSTGSASPSAAQSSVVFAPSPCRAEIPMARQPSTLSCSQAAPCRDLLPARASFELARCSTFLSAHCSLAARSFFLACA